MLNKLTSKYKDYFKVLGAQNSFPGYVVSVTISPNGPVPVYQLGNYPFGYSAPVDSVAGLPDDAEVTVKLRTWDPAKLDGNMLFCPTDGKDVDMLRWLFERAYQVESLVSKVKDLF